jgi:hemerythrin-like domain-containing protein
MAKKVKVVRDAPRETIATLMMMDHGHVIRLLKNFERSFEDDVLLEISESFYALRKKLDNHFETEEHMIFDHLVDPTNAIETELIRLLKEHKTIMQTLDSFWKMLEQGREIPSKEDTKAFLILLKEHARFEDDVFYPRLDAELTPECKRDIVERIITETGYVKTDDDGSSL